jgi:RNA recognition motif-containing protein
LVADAVKVIRNPETQESKGFAFIEAPNQEEMNSIIRRFDRAPLEDRLLRANPAQPPKGKGQVITKPATGIAPDRTKRVSTPTNQPRPTNDRDRARTTNRRSNTSSAGNSVFAEELAKVL